MSGRSLAETDPWRVERIRINLAANALRHGAPSVIVQVHVVCDKRESGRFGSMTTTPASRRAS
jgi:signal transduction histidine kinase